MGGSQVDGKQQNAVESFGGSPIPLEGPRGSSQVKSEHGGVEFGTATGL